LQTLQKNLHSDINQKGIKSLSQYIGRGEVLAKKILLRLIDCTGIQGQVPIKDLLWGSQLVILDPEILKHKFDWVLRRNGGKDIVIEVNYKHKEKASRKWRQIFAPLLQQNGFDLLVINDWDCRPRGLFWLNTAGKHLVITWDDFRDVMDALETCGINPSIRIE